MDPREPLRILLIGSGGREHALAWKLAQSPRVQTVWVAPGNGGTHRGNAKISNVALSVDNIPEVIEFAKASNVNLVFPGPEAPLIAGITDACQAAGLRCFGPSQAAAKLEGSKAFAKDFMQRHSIPTAAYQTFTDAEAAKAWLQSVDFQVVIKADGLAAGKGVVIPKDRSEAENTIDEFLSGRAFGDAGRSIVLEEFLEGEELSVIAFVDGFTIKALPGAQDHKHALDGDKGPMTGGMGCYAPTKVGTPKLMDEIQRTVLQPTIDAMHKEGFPMVGLLFTGFMITPKGPKVLEYNVRGGDPETEVLMPLLETDLVDLILACVGTYLHAVDLRVSPNYCATVITTAGGYPGSYQKGRPITFDTAPSNALLFHAGTKSDEAGVITTNGGRVMACTATGTSLEAAVAAAYKSVGTVHFQDMYYRRDIAHRSLGPANNPPPETTAGPTPLTYADAGVSVDTGNALVQRIKPLVRSTARPGADASIGGFGGLVDLAAAGFNTPPRLICAIDGVGTKLNIAHALGKHDTVGIDCVAMNVNDLIASGGIPLAFLDCYTCGTLDIEVATAFVQGVAEGCRQANCALVGGETAEMPGLFTGGDTSTLDGGVYDAVGAAIGALSEGQPLLPRTDDMRAGDVLLGLASNGMHSNGFSLVRKILERAKLTVHDPAPWDNTQSVGASLLTPTRIYVRALLRAIQDGVVLGMAHITGGGLYENVPRMLPKHLVAEFDAEKWTVPEVFRWMKREGGLSDHEFAKTWNTGLGMVCVVKDGPDVVKAIRDLEEAGEKVWEVGRLVERTSADWPACIINNCAQAWQ